MKYTKMIEPSATEWPDWIAPKHRGYRMACCDCGLVHDLAFAVAKVTRYTKAGFKYKVVSGHRVLMTAKRNNRATAAKRRNKK